MSAFRMLAVDLDGTAVTHQNQVTVADRQAAARLAAIGVPVTIATGRLYSGTRAAAEALGVQGTVAVMNGSEHVHVQEDRSVRGAFLSVREREVVRDAARGLGIAPALFRARTLHHDRANEAQVPYFKIWTPNLHAHDDLFEDSLWTEATDVLAIGLVGPNEVIEGLRQHLTQTLEPPAGMVLFNTFEGDRFMSVRHQTVDKGTAIAELAADRGFCADEVVVVGDWLNDLPMLKAAGRAFAMNGAIQEAQEAADETLTAVRGEGGAIAEIAWKVWGV